MFLSSCGRRVTLSVTSSGKVTAGSGCRAFRIYRSGIRNTSRRRDIIRTGTQYKQYNVVFRNAFHGCSPVRETFTQNLPDLGDSISSGFINEWLVSVGDYVEENQVIAVVDTDKVSVEIHSPVSGVLTKQYVTEVGGEVQVKAPLADFDTSASPSTSASTTAIAASSTSTSATNEPGSGSGEIYTHNLPDLGDSISSGYINEWVVDIGDYVEENQVLAVIDTDKVSVEINSPVSGTVVKKYKTEQGDKVNVKEPLVDIELGAASATQKQQHSPPTQQQPLQQPQQQTNPHGGRVPLIKFRHGYRAAAAAGTYASATTSSTPTTKEGQTQVLDFMDVPPLYGRLPPMTEEEMETVLLGGAK